MKPASEDQLIRRLAVGAVAIAIVGLVASALAVVAMISANFNPLGWLE